MDRQKLRTFRFRLFCICAAAAVLSAGSLRASPPWELLAPAKKVEADPNSAYPVEQSNGPWMIVAHTFQGDKAEEQAKALVFELRSKYHLPAYTHSKTYDFTQKVQGRGLDPYGHPKVMRYQQAEVVKEVAVMVGDYNTVDDPLAQKTLAKIKQMQPDCLRDQPNGGNQTLTAFQQLQQPFLSASSDKRQKGPMAHAFIATNPLLPPEYFATKGVDKLVVEMNKDVPNSLLDCKGQYTVKVATFTGAVLLDQKKIEEVEHGKHMASRLAEAAEKAHKLTTVLREKGYEAYEFHDRESSIVCVGSFDSVGSQGLDGKFSINPTIQKIMKTFGAESPGLTGGQLKPKSVDGIPFDVQSTPIEVPRRSIGADYQRSMLSDR